MMLGMYTNDVRDVCTPMMLGMYTNDVRDVHQSTPCLHPPYNLKPNALILNELVLPSNTNHPAGLRPSTAK